MWLFSAYSGKIELQKVHHYSFETIKQNAVVLFCYYYFFWTALWHNVETQVWNGHEAGRENEPLGLRS